MSWLKSSAPIFCRGTTVMVLSRAQSVQAGNDPAKCSQLTGCRTQLVPAICAGCRHLVGRTTQSALLYSRRYVSSSVKAVCTYTLGSPANWLRWMRSRLCSQECTCCAISCTIGCTDSNGQHRTVPAQPACVLGSSACGMPWQLLNQYRADVKAAPLV
jgi:hypothetical protein